MKNLVIFCSFFRNTFKSSDFINSVDFIEKKKTSNLSDYNHFIFKNRFKVNKLFSSEKLRYSDNCILIMLPRSSERIFNPMRYTGRYLKPYIYLKIYAS